MKLISVSEAIKTNVLKESFLEFVNEAAPATHEPSIERIQKCIKDRKFAGIYYEEEGNGKVLSGYRLIAPVCFGRGYKHPVDEHISHHLEYYLRAYVIMESKKAENKNLRKLNRRSVSKSNRIPYYRLFKLDRIEIWDTLRFTITKEPAPGYNPQDKMIAEIMTSIEF